MCDQSLKVFFIRESKNICVSTFRTHTQVYIGNFFWNLRYNKHIILMRPVFFLNTGRLANLSLWKKMLTEYLLKEETYSQYLISTKLMFCKYVICISTLLKHGKTVVSKLKATLPKNSIITLRVEWKLVQMAPYISSTHEKLAKIYL